ncbi:MAG: histidine phosphatase family protein [Rhodospirillaceae bacterium]|nr:histidine phosphatase family protein [Rhodospirillaceae bacterium]
MQREVRWWWVRHAPVINPSGNIYGQLDRKADLSNDAAFAALAQRLPRGAAWCVTPLSRTQDTAARLIAEGTDPLGDPAVEPAFLEQSFGDWQGRPHAEVAPRGHLAWLAPATFRPPGGESFADLCARAAPRLDAIAADPPAADIVAVAHGGTIRAVLGHCLGLDPETALRFRIATLSLTRIIRLAPEEGEPVWLVDAVNS